MYSTLSTSHLGPATSLVTGDRAALERLPPATPYPPTVPSRDQLAGAVGPAPRPSQVTSQSSQARLAGRPGPGFVFLATRIFLVAGTQVLRGSDDCHRAAGRWVRPPAAPTLAAGGQHSVPHAYLAPNGPQLALLPRQGRGGGAGAHWSAAALCPPLAAFIGRSSGARGIGGGGAPPTLRPSRGRRGSGHLPASRPSGSLAGSRLLPALSRLPLALAPARRRRVSAAAGGARSEGRPPHCPGGCPNLAPQSPGTPQGPSEAGKGGGHRPAGRGDDQAGGLRA